ncbi:hypothetical protein ASZ78_011716 [Callipepla squamata]|uniref:Uncharacterized protein n=1 Tax=Callipepla squamata TaxID=9009 RepID=A0A226MLH5_CALSU|nr:hypothetical protein ASZ78_011716 [Callipepla squamata]
MEQAVVSFVASASDCYFLSSFQGQDVSNAILRTDRPETTLIFSDENEMDMTTSHTAVIARNLKNSETDKTEKIDIVSFLAELNSISGKAETSKDFHFSFDPATRFCPSFEEKEDATAGKKTDSNEFSMDLNSNDKALNPIEGPEKENLFFVPSQVSKDVARSSVEFVYSSERVAICNVTKIFREQDDGMEMTKCHAADIQNMRSGICEAPTEQLPSADVTRAFADDGMDMTTNQTAKIHFPFAIVDNENVNFKKDFSSMELDSYSVVKRTSHQQLIIKPEPQLCTSKKIAYVEDTGDATALRASKQETRTLSSIPGSVSSETVFRDDKTVVFSQCDDMEMTGNYTDVFYNESTKGLKASCQKAFEKAVNRNPWLGERRHPVNNDNTRSLSFDDGSSLSHKNSARGLSSGSEGRNERVTQDHSAASLNAGSSSCADSVSTDSSKRRLQHRLANSLLVSLPGEKTAIFSGADIDLTKNCVGKGRDENAHFNNNPQSGDDLRLRGVEERSLASNSKLQGSSQLPSFLEKSGVFPPGENMGLSENCALVAPHQNICIILPGRKAAPGHIEDKSSSKKEVMVANSQEQPGCDTSSLVSHETGVKHVLSADEKTAIFVEGADMDITGNHTDSAGSKRILQSKLSNDDVSSISEDKTFVFTQNNDMEISRLDSVAADSAMETAVSRGMFSTASGSRRKSLKGAVGKKTLVFSLSENNDMSITEGLTAAISHEMVSRNEVGLPSLSSAHPVRTVAFVSNQADADIKPCSADKITAKAPFDDELNLDKVVGQEGPSNRETTVFATSDMEITKVHDVSLKANVLQGRQPNQSVPLNSSVIFTSDQADMEMTEHHPVNGIIERDSQVVQEALSDSKTVIFPLAENMDITKTHAALSGEVGVWNGRSIPTVSADPANKTIVFCHNQDDMEITSSHTVAVNNNTAGPENQEVSHESAQQPDLRSASSSSCRDEGDSLQPQHHLLRKGFSKP